MKKLLFTSAVITLFIPALAFAKTTTPPKSSPPVIASHADITVESPTGIPRTVTYTNPTATDQKDGTDPVSCTPASGSTFPLGETVVTCTATDSSGNHSSETFGVMVKDTTPPSVLSVSLSSSDADLGVAIPGDTITLSFTTSEKVEPPIVLVNARPVIMRATNVSGNSWAATYTITNKDPLGTAQYLITLQDTSGNVYACSSVKTLFEILVKYCPTTDGSSVNVEKAPPPPSPDTIPPVIAAHADVYATTTSDTAETAVVTYALPTATDNVDGTDPVSCTPTSGSDFPLGITPVSCTSSDKAGNTSASTFNVIVSRLPDTVPPVIAPHTDVYATTTSDTATVAVVAYTLPAATDNVDGTDPVSCTPASGSAFAIGITPISCSASDAAGNTATSTFNIILAQLPDTIPPVISGVADISTTTSGASAVVTYAVPTAVDDKDGAVPVSCTPPSGSTFDLGTTTVTCTASDAAGNSATSTFAVGVAEAAPQNGLSGSPVVDSLDSAAGWSTYAGGETFMAATSGCQASGCVNSGTTLTGQIPRMYKTGTPTDQGSLTVWSKYNIGYAGMGSAFINVCIGSPDNDICDGWTGFQIPDNSWHEYYLAWKDDAQGNKDFCKLTDNTNPADCTWSPSGVFSAGDEPDTVVLGSTAAGRPDLGDELWFDELGN